MKKILAMLLVLSMVFALAACGAKEEAPAAPVEEPAAEAPVEEAPVEEAPAEEEVAVMTHEEFVAAELDSKVCVETYVQAKQGWWNDQVTVYTQAEDGAYFLYNMPCTEAQNEELTVGTKIRVTGWKAEWSGEVEITEAEFEIIEGNYVAEAAELNELLGTEELIAHQNELVKFTGLTVVASVDAEGNEAPFLYGWDGSGEEGTDADLYFTLTDGTNNYTFVIEYYLNGGSDVYAAVQALEVGQVVDVEGFLYWYDGMQPHVTALTVVG